MESVGVTPSLGSSGVSGMSENSSSSPPVRDYKELCYVIR